MKHLYDGSMDGSHPCDVCGVNGFTGDHFFNGTNVACDYDNGPCACGAWHKPENFAGEWSRISKMTEAEFVDWLKANWTGSWVVPEGPISLPHRYQLINALEHAGQKA